MIRRPPAELKEECEKGVHACVEYLDRYASQNIRVLSYVSIYS